MTESRRRAKRQKAAADRSSLEWECVVILNEDDDVNPIVQCKFCPWKSGAGATRIRNHILCTGSGGAAKCSGSSAEYNTVKAKLLEKAASTKKRDAVECSIKKVCMAALQEENERLKVENQRLQAYIALLEANAQLRAQADAIQMLPVAVAREI